MRRPLLAARAIAVLWVAFWIWFGLASGFAERLDPRGILIHTAVPGFVFAALAGIAWKWKRTGGYLLIAVGALVAIAYPILFHRLPLAMQIPTELSLALPPLIAGMLFLKDWRMRTAPN